MDFCSGVLQLGVTDFDAEKKKMISKSLESRLYLLMAASKSCPYHPSVKIKFDIVSDVERCGYSMYIIENLHCPLASEPPCQKNWRPMHLPVELVGPSDRPEGLIYHVMEQMR